VRKLNNYLVLIGVGLFALLLLSLDMQALGAILVKANPSWIVAGFGMAVGEFVMRGLALRRLTTRTTNRPFPFPTSFNTTLMGVAFGAVTPGKLGDFVKILAIQRFSKAPLVSCLAIAFAERVINLLTLLTLGLLGLGSLALFGRMDGQLWLALIPALTIVPAMLLLLNKGFTQRVIRPFARFAIPERFKKSARINFNNFYSGLSLILNQRGNFAVVFLFLSGAWGFLVVREFFFAQALGLQVPFLYFLFVGPLVVLVELLPISILGLGTRDYALVILLSVLGITKEASVSLSLLMLGIGLLPFVGYGYFLAWRQKITEGLNPHSMTPSPAGGEENT
jgi:hypothetical protein